MAAVPVGNRIAAHSAPSAAVTARQSRRADAALEPAGWAPDVVTVVPARRRPGIAAGTLDAVRGVVETGAGQPLSPLQRQMLAPFLAGAFGVPQDQARADLDAVRLYVGGPAAGRPGWAAQVDHSIYVAGERELTRILSWPGRRWLAHELGHVMQWRAGSDGSDLDRTRHGVAAYTAGMALDPRLRPGAIPRGLWNWAAARVRGDARPPSLFGAVHDAHHIEREAERHAVAFRDATEPIAQPPAAPR